MHVLDGHLGRAPHAHVPRVEPECLRHAREALRLARVVELHDRPQEPRGERAMRRIVYAAGGLAHRVRGAGGVRAIRKPCQHRGGAHVVARLQVFALRERDAQVAGDVLHRQQRDRVGEGLVVDHRVALDRVR